MQKFKELLQNIHQNTFSSSLLPEKIENKHNIQKLILLEIIKEDITEDQIIYIFNFLITNFDKNLIVVINTLIDYSLRNYKNSIKLHTIILDYYILFFHIEKAQSLHENSPFFINDIDNFFKTKNFKDNEELKYFVRYYLVVAEMNFYLKNFEYTDKIYSDLFYIILYYTPEIAIQYTIDVYSFCSNKSFYYKIFKIIIENINSEEVYFLLFDISKTGINNNNFEEYKNKFFFIIKHLLKKNIPITQLNNIEVLQNQHFILDLMQDTIMVHKATSHLLQKNIPDLVKVYPLEVKKNKKLRIGVNLTRYNSSDFETSIISLFKHFDKNAFEIVFFAGSEWKDTANFTALATVFDKIIPYKTMSWEDLREKVYAEKVDIFLSENIYRPASVLISYSRVAPIQINFYDRFTSFATPFIDYYCTFGKKGLYKTWTNDTKLAHEKYAHISQSYVCPTVHKLQPKAYNLQSIGLPKNAKFLFYPQTTSRLMVEDDYIIQRLLEKNPQLYFITLTISRLETFRHYYRWRGCMPHVLDRILFLQKLNIENFIGVIQQASCILGSFASAHGTLTNTTIFAQNCPIVAGYGKTFTSSLTKTMYETMGVEGLIANTHEEAIQICQRLLDDAAWKEQKSLEIQKNYHKLDTTQAAALELQDFFVQAYDRALAKKAPEHWNHGKFEDDI